MNEEFCSSCFREERNCVCEKEETKEYWKITELKKYLLVLCKEDKLRCDVTRSAENDTKMKIKLLEEGFKAGSTQTLKQVQEVIDNLSTDIIKNYQTGIQRNMINVKELKQELAKIGTETQCKTNK
jgi:hypothetical protein